MKHLVKLGMAVIVAVSSISFVNAATLAAGSNSPTNGAEFTVDDNAFLENAFNFTASAEVIMQFQEAYSAMGATAASAKGSTAAYGATTEGGGVVNCTDGADIDSAGAVTGLTAVATTGCAN